MDKFVEILLDRVWRIDRSGVEMLAEATVDGYTEAATLTSRMACKSLILRLATSMEIHNWRRGEDRVRARPKMHGLEALLQLAIPSAMRHAELSFRSRWLYSHVGYGTAAQIRRSGTRVPKHFDNYSNSGLRLFCISRRVCESAVCQVGFICQNKRS